MKAIIFFFILFFNFQTYVLSEEQIIGSVGLAIGKITNQNGQILKAGDDIYLGDIIQSEDQSKSQILLLDQTVITLGEKTSITLDEFVFNSDDSKDKILTTIINGSIKVLSGKISQGNPEDLVVKIPAGTIGARGTEFQTIVDEVGGTSKVLLIGPGENNSLGLRPGAIEVTNALGSVILNTPFAFTEVDINQEPSPPITISNEQLEEFKNSINATNNLQSKNVQEAVKETVKEGLFNDNQITGNEIIGDIVIAALNLSDGGITFDEIAEALGVNLEQLLGEDFQASIENESTENQILMANAEGGDGLAYILKYGGANLGDTTYGDFQGIASGTYTYTGNNINMVATKGSGSGTYSGVTAVNFATKVISNTYSGTLGLGSEAQTDFSYSNTVDYSSETPENMLRNRIVFSIDNSDGTTAEAPIGGADGFNPNNYKVTADDYHADGETSFSNVQMNGSPNPSTGSVGNIALNVLQYDADGIASENVINGQRTGIMPSRK